MTSHPSYAKTGLTWDEVETLCERSDAVESYDRTEDGGLTIEWCDGNESVYADGQQTDAANEIAAMSAT